MAPCELTIKPSATPVTIIGHYQAAALSTVSVAGPRRETHVADIQVLPGKPIVLMFVTYTPTLYRFSGATHRIRRLYLLNDYGSGETGIARRRVAFGTSSGCRISYDLFGRQNDNHRKEAKSRFDWKVDYAGGTYNLYRATVGDGWPAYQDAPRVAFDVKGPAGIYLFDRDQYYPGGIVTVDPRKVVSSQPAVSYRTLPSTAGIVQLILAGSLKLLGWSGARPIIEAEVSAGRVSEDRAHTLLAGLHGDILFVTRPIDVPVELCGSHLVHFLAPDSSYLRGNLCHSDAHFLYGDVASAGMR